MSDIKIEGLELQEGEVLTEELLAETSNGHGTEEEEKEYE